MRKYEIKKLDMEINIAPLIDVVFLLLLFFMLASTLDTNEIRATIQLPQAEGQISREKDKSIALYLDKNGMIYVGKEHISWDVLPSYLKENIGGFHDSHDSIEVYADKEVDFDYVARIMVMGGKLEIEKINFLLKHEYVN
jgi:biopolymer transport protein ExbD